LIDTCPDPSLTQTSAIALLRWPENIGGIFN
jgi:hypothetical protein